MEPQSWSLNSGVSHQQLIEAVSSKYSIESSDAQEETVTLLDDPDFALWQAGLILARKDYGRFCLYGEDTEFQVDKVKLNAKFWWDFPASDLREQLAAYIDLRAILAVTTFKISGSRHVLRNDDGKIVLRVNVTFLVDEEGKNGRLFVELAPLRGYHKELKIIVEQLKPLLSEQLDSLSLYAKVRHSGFAPQVPPKKKEFGISADETVEESVRQMSLAMLSVARANEQGIIEDIDTEFLHHYRVSLRKTRSLVNLMKKAFPPELHLKLKTLLAELASKTNDLRDMDVFLLSRDYYQQMLPENFIKGFDQLFGFIAKDREKARKQVQRSFHDASHDKAFDEVMALLGDEPLFCNGFAKQPVKQAAQKKILKRYQKIGLLGEQISDQTPDEEVHELRIECKKLRYMMEFFAELFPKKRIRDLVKTLKKLQTILGDFNDYSVQKEFLAEYGKTHSKSVELAAAINGLIAVLHQKQIQERSKVQQAFAAFNQQEVINEFNELFAT
ncbi:MAG: CHAD domain-containing protein, partial [Gammaproteobacteria bacterium]|nr:CHAD domain-containing protein [Gammaproteobacteria bacterium]